MKIARFFKETSPMGRCLVLVGTMILGLIVSSGVVSLLGWTELSREQGVLSQMVSQIGCFLMPAVVVALLFYESPDDLLRYKQIPHQARWMLVGILALLLALPVSSGLEWLNNQWHWPASMADMEQQMRAQGAQMEQTVKEWLMVDGWGKMVLNLLLIALLPAVCEEAFFRGCLQQIVTGWSGRKHLAVILTAVIFSLAHGNLFAFLPRFALGVLLGYLFLYSKSLWVNISAHFVNNAILVVWYFIQNS